MQNLLKNKDFTNIFILISCIVLCFILFYGHFGDIVVDCGREAFLPTVAFDKNNIFYRDIFCLYPPLSYQINGILYKIFGENLRVLYFAGLFNTLIVFLSFYYISRHFLNSFFSFLMGFFFIFYCVFGVVAPCMGFIFPYSYGYVYGYCGFLVSIALFLKYIKKNDFKYLFLSFFALGFSLANKFEFSFTLIVFILALFILKPKISFNKILFLVLGFIIIPFLSYGYLFLQGLNFNDIREYMDFGRRFFATPAYKSFSEITFKDFVNSCYLFLISFSGFICLFLYMSKSKKTNNHIVFFISILSLYIFYISYNLKITYLYSFTSCFACLSIPTLFITIYIIYISKNKLTKQNASFLLILVSFLLITVKNYLFLGKFNYGYYQIPLFVLLNVIFIKNYCGKIMSKQNLKSFFSIMIIGISLITFCYQAFSILHYFNYKIETPKGIIYTEQELGKSIKRILYFVNHHTKKDDVILVLQEGTIINFLTDRKTDLMLYHLIDIHIQTLGEDYVIKRLKSNKPDCIIIIKTNKITPLIQLYIKNNYRHIIRLNRAFARLRTSGKSGLRAEAVGGGNSPHP